MEPVSVKKKASFLLLTKLGWKTLILECETPSIKEIKYKIFPYRYAIHLLCLIKCLHAWHVNLPVINILSFGFLFILKIILCKRWIYLKFSKSYYSNAGGIPITGDAASLVSGVCIQERYWKAHRLGRDR